MMKKSYLTEIKILLEMSINDKELLEFGKLKKMNL
jgi:hypothetical protein